MPILLKNFQVMLMHKIVLRSDPYAPSHIVKNLSILWRFLLPIFNDLSNMGYTHRTSFTSSIFLRQKRKVQCLASSIMFFLFMCNALSFLKVMLFLPSMDFLINVTMLKDSAHTHPLHFCLFTRTFVHMHWASCVFH